MSEFLDSLVTVSTSEELLACRKDAKERYIPIIRDKSFNLLLTLVKLRQPERILEIGMAIGLSAIGMLLEAKSAKLTSIEIDEVAIKEARENFKKFGVDDRATVFDGDASAILQSLTGRYDFIFLDGAKGHYREYLPYLLEALNVGGILFADNVLFRGYIENAETAPKKYNTTIASMQDFLREISYDKRLKTTVLDIEDGVSLSLRIE